MSGTVIALDVGTTHVKAALFDETGRVLRMEKFPTPLSETAEGSVYRAEELWGAVRSQVEKLCGASPEKPLGIAVSGMAEAGLVVGKTAGEARTEILPWFDTRTRALAERTTREEADAAFRTTGLRNSFKYGIYKYLWLLREKGFKKEDTVWLSVCDYIAFRLTGKFVTDPTFAARTYVYNVLKKKWDGERIRRFGLSAANFPEVVPSGKSFGTYRGIPVAVAGHDHVCAAFGLLFRRRNGLCDSAGTSETYVGILPESACAPGFPAESGLLYGPFVDGGYFYMANVPSSGHSVEWFRKKLQLREVSYEEIDSRLSELGREPSGILYFPYLTGMGSPWYRADIRGVLAGLTENRDGFQILKGITEGIQYQAKWLLSILEGVHGVRADSLVCAGGSVRNRAMMQIKADVLNRRVEIPAAAEATLCGAAALFLLKNAGRDRAERFLANAARTEKTYRADEAVQKKYERIFREEYLPFVKMLKEYHDRRNQQEKEII